MSVNPWRLGRLTRKQPGGGTYWSFCIKWNDEDGPHRVSLGTTDRAAAEAAARDFWSRRQSATADTVGEIVERYLQTQIGKDGEKRKLEAWAAAKAFWADRRMHMIQPDADEPGTGAEYILQRSRAANTVRKELGLINTALIWARTKGLIERVPKIVLPAMPESVVEHLSKAKFRRFLAGCRMPHVVLFAQLAVLTGARVTALLQLKWEQVDFERRQISLNPAGRLQKANKGRALVTMNPRLHDLLQEAKAGALSEYVIEVHGEPIASIRKGMEAASARSGVHCTPHMLRHTAAVWMAEDRVPMEEIASFLGHKDTRITTRVYARFSPDYLQRAASSLDW